MAREPLIGIVGPCGAGKSTLAANLATHYQHVRAIAQEHSYVPDMWRRITNPDILVYLDASYAATVERRQLGWTEKEYRIELDRLANARIHADIHILTDNLDPKGVLEACLKELSSLQAE